MHHGRHRRRPERPRSGGPLALRRVPPETRTVTPRLDILSQAQRRALHDTTGTAVLDDDQASVPLAALAASQKWQSDAYPGLRARPGPTPRPRSSKPG